MEQEYLEQRQLLERYNAGLCSPEEERVIRHWYNREAQSETDQFEEGDYEQMRNEIWAKLPASMQQLDGKREVKVLRLNRFKWIAVAAAVVVVVFGFWFYTYRPVVNRDSETVAQNAIAPGSNRAVLTSADGKRIQLSGRKTGVVIDNDKLVYNDGTNINDPSLAKALSPQRGEMSMMLTATTPRGGTYRFTLSDGTNVWLNADSKLEFPSNFSNLQHRVVRLSGEAYFEVAKDKMHPFVVQTDKQKVTVLGTHFNINSYSDQAYVKTTLLEGAVELSSFGAKPGDGGQLTLKPNQCAVLTEGALKLATANIEVDMAWKNGWFQFEDSDLKMVMDQIGRWYDVAVIYQGKIPEDHFDGKVSRNVKISKVLEILEKSGINFKIEGRTIIVK